MASSKSVAAPSVEVCASCPCPILVLGQHPIATIRPHCCPFFFLFLGFSSCPRPCPCCVSLPVRCVTVQTRDRGVFSGTGVAGRSTWLLCRIRRTIPLCHAPNVVADWTFNNDAFDHKHNTAVAKLWRQALLTDADIVGRIQAKLRAVPVPSDTEPISLDVRHEQVVQIMSRAIEQM